MKQIIIPFLAIILSFNAFAQKPNREKMKAFKIAHITEQLDLTEKEAQAFWPIYNAHEETRLKLRDNSVRNRLEELSNSSSKNEISEAEAKKLLDKIVKMEFQKQEIQHDYYHKLSTILSSKKTLKLMHAERSFRRKMIDEFKERHRGARPKRN